MTPAEMAIAAAVVAGVPSVFAWLLKRSVEQLDTSLAKLDVSIQVLTKRDTETQVELAKIRTRLDHVEIELANLKKAMR